VPHCGETHQLSYDAWKKQRKEAHGCQDYQAFHGNHSLAH